MFPLETVRTRLAVDHAKYRGVLTSFRIILATEGFPALYRVRIKAPLNVPGNGIRITSLHRGGSQGMLAHAKFLLTCHPEASALCISLFAVSGRDCMRLEAVRLELERALGEVGDKLLICVQCLR